jgi:folate-dependent phosphoribosylglycinamide formyltransferase PurN
MLTRPGRDPLRVALLCSRRAPGLAYLLDHDPHRGRSYELVVAVTSDPECGERERLAVAGVPRALNDIRRFYAARNARLGDLDHRPDYDRATMQILARFRPDLVILCGYLHILTGPMLETYPERAVNIHDADLTLTDAASLPKYRGLHAVRDAVFAGERETRSTVHLVTPEVDVGPPLLRSWAFPTHPLIDAARRSGATDILKAYAYAHREWMMGASWGPLLATTIDLYAHDQIRLRDGRTVVAGALGPRDVSAEAMRETAPARQAAPLGPPAVVQRW